MAQREQLPGEACTTYIEEILRLYKAVTTRISDEHKAGYVLKVIAEEMCNLLTEEKSLNAECYIIQQCPTLKP